MQLIKQKNLRQLKSRKQENQYDNNERKKRQKATHSMEASTESLRLSRPS